MTITILLDADLEGTEPRRWKTLHSVARAIAYDARRAESSAASVRDAIIIPQTLWLNFTRRASES
jgi:hypothetical protein